MTFRVTLLFGFLIAACFARQVVAADAPPELVSQIQQDLKSLGYDPGPADGTVTTKTQLAIASFEADNGLPFTGQASFELAFKIRGALGSGASAAANTSAPAAAEKSAAELQQECLQQAAAEQQDAKKWNALSNLGSKIAGQLGGYEAAQDVYEAKAAISDVSTVAKEFGISESAAQDCMNQYPGSGSGATATLVAASAAATAPGAGSANPSKVLLEECTAKAKSDPGYNACAVTCSSAAQYAALPTANPSSREQLDARCRQEYDNAIVAGQAKEAEAAATLAAVDNSAVGAPAPGDYIYSYEFGEHIRLDPPNARMRAIKIPSSNGRPRFGHADSFGVNDLLKKNTLSADQNTAYRMRLQDMRLHRTAYVTLLAMRFVEPQISAADKSIMYIGSTASGDNWTVEDGRNRMLRGLVNSASQLVASPDVFPTYFCNKRTKKCHPPTPIAPAIGVQWAGALADEFERRDAFRAFMATDHDDLVRWGRSMPTEAILVLYGSLGEYEFDSAKFPGSIQSPPTNREYFNAGGSTSWLVRMRRAEDDVLSGHGVSFDLPMSVDDARKLRERLPTPLHRRLYAVNRIRFTGAAYDDFHGFVLTYTSESDRLNLCFDEALTDCLAEVTVTSQ